MNIKILKAACVSLALSTSCYVNANLIENGDFETGDLSNWNVSSNGNSGCDTDWTVALNDDGICWNLLADPSAGYEAYNSFDGNGPQTFALSQMVDLGALNSYSLAFDYAVTGDNGWTWPIERTFSVIITDGSLVETLFSKSIKSINDPSWFSEVVSFDHSVFAAMDLANISISFNAFIPENFTGPASLGLDNVALTQVPEPSTLAIFALGILGLTSRKIKK
ncbi:PEP-CTERM sorting domain-containing protein [Litorilituus lipolyticus]|uniref:PEP-CTERM sorting domain-containing protein n=1 Tax=Litorilituus lipolyticus TaxID=2491017 RepID=A0A502KR00_9GAMM|nr:PEP-CTERM sorting domain-containing protein [Litorilituus lipolyticus]TPH13926.1 PEP-CTERM sorting domain-containing protein [Litorilituus lipolyticus]